MSYTQQNGANPYFSNELLMHLLGIPLAETTCGWVTEHGHPCGATLLMDRDIVSTHLRNDHALGGESKELVTCFWWSCQSRPIQRQSMIRHVLSVHLQLLRWTCPLCLRTFARRWTKHDCHPAGQLFPHA